MSKRKSLATAAEAGPSPNTSSLPTPKRRATGRRSVNPEVNDEVLDGPEALRASPDADSRGDVFRADKALSTAHIKQESHMAEDMSDVLPSLTNTESSESDLSEIGDDEPGSPGKIPVSVTRKGKVQKVTAAGPARKAPTARPPAPVKKEKEEEEVTKKQAREQFLDPEADDEDPEVGEEEIKAASERPPPVNSDYLPLPWKGRLGYACLNTYLRFSNPPVFASRTCRIASILENRHPLQNPDQPPHPTKNRPDKEQPADVSRGMRFVESLGLANARDCIKMLRWNERYGIRFMRLSSEMFPFASHEEYGYKLAPFAAGVLGEVGKVAGELGHRLTTHPGQFTQLGSPRQVVIDNAIRDLEYHEEMLSLLRLPEQQDRDAVMILHLGGVFGDKAATMQRFRENYARLSPGIKKRLVLENDDVCYSVHDLLPLCEELNIPFVLDYHHHNIVFDSSQMREGTKDIIDLYPRILATWRRKKITPKMHYSEPTPPAITGMQRRKHNPRPATLPPCPPDMDLMIEAKDKEQAVFELMRTFKLPGFDTFADIIPHVRKDENKPVKTPKKKQEITPKKKKRAKKSEEEDHEEALEEVEAEPAAPEIIPEDEVGMGGPQGRVYWPPGMEEWLRPKKRVVKKKEGGEDSAAPKGKNKGKKAAADAAADAARAAAKLEAETAEASKSSGVAGQITPSKPASRVRGGVSKVKGVQASAAAANGKRAASTKAGGAAKKTKMEDKEDEEEEEMTEEDSEAMELHDSEDSEVTTPVKGKEKGKPAARPRPGRQASRKQVNYTAGMDTDEE